MEDIIKKFNIYDHLGYLLVGAYQAICLWALYYIISNKWSDSSSTFPDLKFSVNGLLISYFLGHVIQAISNVFGKEEERLKETKNKEFEDILSYARRFFKLSQSITDKQVWQYCYLFALSNDFSGHVEYFNALHSLYRGWWIASKVNFIMAAWFLMTDLRYSLSDLSCASFFLLVLFFFGSLGLMILFAERKVRFWHYMNRKNVNNI